MAEDKRCTQAPELRTYIPYRRWLLPRFAATVKPEPSDRCAYARFRARQSDRSHPGRSGHAARCVALRLVDDHVPRPRGLHLYGRGRAPAVVRRPGRTVALADGLVQRTDQRSRPPRVQPRCTVDGDWAHQLSHPDRSVHRDLVLLRHPRHHLREDPPSGPPPAVLRRPQPHCVRPRALTGLRVRGDRAQRHRRPELGLLAVSYTHLRAHETVLDLVCRL